MLGGGEREFTRVKVAAAMGTIELLLPDMPGVASAVIYASETEGPRAHGPAQPVTKVSMNQVASLAKRKGGSNDGRR